MKVSWTRSSRLPRWPLWAVAVVTAWAGLAAAVTGLSAAAGGAHTACWFKEFTGVPCPSCGSSRAAIALAEGRMLDAVASNPLLVTAGGAMMLWLLVRLLTGRRLAVALSRREQITAAVAGGLALAANWIFLICQGR